MRIAVLGLGYVGATSMACLAKLGHAVIGVDVSAEKVALVDRGESPILEPQVPELLAEAHASGRVSATADARKAIENCDAALVCVGTPSRPNGAVDARFLIEVLRTIAAVRNRTKRVIPVFVRSTALPAVHEELIDILLAGAEGQQPAYCVHPEFLREGQAVADFFDPPKIIFGCTDSVAEAACKELYPGFEAPIVMAPPAVAAMVKYADNCFHAVKVTFGNEIGMISRTFGVDARQVMDIFCLDTKLNISPKYLKPGLPYGGSCLPKDLRSVVAWARQNSVSLPMLEHVSTSNESQVQHILAQVLHADRKRIGLIGLAFKDNTDDLRESPMVAMAEHLLGKGREVRIYDENLSPDDLVGGNRSFAMSSLPHLASMLVKDCADLVAGSDIVVVARDIKAARFAALPWRQDQLVFDLVGLTEAAQVQARVRGLYWPGQSALGAEAVVAAE
jgi:GDP-mannose 6-dehydrogenase